MAQNLSSHFIQSPQSIKIIKSPQIDFFCVCCIVKVESPDSAQCEGQVRMLREPT